jgi:hypothetical protein
MRTAQVPGLGILLCMLACGGQKEATNSDDVSHTFILDSLLAYDSEKALIEKFGAGNIGRDTAWLPEGVGQIMVTLLYPGTKNEVTFEWSDSVSYSTLDAVEVNADSSDWSSHGVKIGTPMSELVDLNGGDFTFSGFDWDYGGYAFFGDEGKLRGVTIRLGSSAKEMTQEQQDSLIGDQQVTSRSQAARANDPVVKVIRLMKERD